MGTEIFRQGLKNLTREGFHFMKWWQKIIFFFVLGILFLFVIRFWTEIWEFLLLLFGFTAVGISASKSKEKGMEKLQDVKKREGELEQKAKNRKEEARILAEEDAKQKTEIEDWRKQKEEWKSGKPKILLIFLCLLLIFSSPAIALESPENKYADFTREELISKLIEAEYLLDIADEKLLKETQLKEKYLALYIFAEKDLELEMDLSKEKNKIIIDQEKEIEFLEYRLKKMKNCWALTGGIYVSSRDIGWSLGIFRKWGMGGLQISLVNGKNNVGFLLGGAFWLAP